MSLTLHSLPQPHPHAARAKARQRAIGATLPRIRAAALALLVTAATLAPGPGAAQSFPVTVESCGRSLQFDAPPARMASTGSNLIEILLALGLEDRIHGVSARPERLAASAGMFPAASGLRILQQTGLSLEILLEEEVDFLFAGWSYGLRPGSDMTPERLGAQGIAVYELSESCIRLGQQVPPSFDYLYRDLRNLAAIFGVSDRAEALMADYETRLAAVAARVADKADRPAVFLYDSGDRVAVTAGAYAMPQAIISAAGGRNVMEDLASSWGRVDWETVISRAPEVIVIVDYGAVSAAEKIALFQANPAFAQIPAVRDNRFLVLGYDDLTPGPRNIHAAETLAAYLHPVP